MRTHVYFADLFYFILEAGLMTAKCQTQRRVAKVCRLKLFFLHLTKMSPNLYFLFSWRTGLINPNMAVMESDNLHAVKEKVKIISITVLEHQGPLLVLQSVLL